MERAAEVRFHAAGLIVFAVFVLVSLIGRASSAVAIARIAVIVFAVAALAEVAVNMIRHRDVRVRSRLLRLLGRRDFASSSRKP